MSARHTQIEEPLYDASTLKKVTALAERLQREQHDGLTARELEAIGGEVGLHPTFVRAALATIQTEEPSEGLTREQGKKVALVGCYAAVHTLLTFWLCGGYFESGFWAVFMFLVAPVILPPLVGLLTRRPRLGMAVGFALIAANLLAGVALTITAGGGPAESMAVAGFIYAAAGLSTAGGLGWFGGWLRERPTKRAVRAPRSVPAEPSREVLLRELFELQRQLEGPKVHRAFLSVDVASAAELKRGESELAVEYSFGEFRRWVGEVAGSHGGCLVPAIGEGVLCVFSDEVSAARAARQLQQSLHSFNASVHRLSQPFRIRCGITGGEVRAASLNSSTRPQSWLVDHAIALQRSAAPGDILLSEVAAGPALPVLGTLARGVETVEGEAVFSWRGQGRASGADKDHEKDLTWA